MTLRCINHCTSSCLTRQISATRLEGSSPITVVTYKAFDLFPSVCEATIMRVTRSRRFPLTVLEGPWSPASDSVSLLRDSRSPHAMSASAETFGSAGSAGARAAAGVSGGWKGEGWGHRRTSSLSEHAQRRKTDYSVYSFIYLSVVRICCRTKEVSPPLPQTKAQITSRSLTKWFYVSEEQHEGKSAFSSSRKLVLTKLWTCDHKEGVTRADGMSGANVLTANRRCEH